MRDACTCYILSFLTTPQKVNFGYRYGPIEPQAPQIVTPLPIAIVSKGCYEACNKGGMKSENIQLP